MADGWAVPQVQSGYCGTVWRLACGVFTEAERVMCVTCLRVGGAAGAELQCG